jgi:lipopolysaccharide biosynthesis glycosyltransferase
MHVKLTPIPSNITKITSVVYGKAVDSLVLFKKCATLKLWLPDLLPQERAVINLDTDMIVLESLKELWAEFSSFSDTTIFGLAEEVYFGQGWYDFYRRIKV